MFTAREHSSKTALPYRLNLRLLCSSVMNRPRVTESAERSPREYQPLSTPSSPPIREAMPSLNTIFRGTAIQPPKREEIEEYKATPAGVDIDDGHSSGTERLSDEMEENTRKIEEDFMPEKKRVLSNNWESLPLDPPARPKKVENVEFMGSFLPYRAAQPKSIRETPTRSTLQSTASPVKSEDEGEIDYGLLGVKKERDALYGEGILDGVEEEDHDKRFIEGPKTIATIPNTMPDRMKQSFKCVQGATGKPNNNFIIEELQKLLRVYTATKDMGRM